MATPALLHALAPLATSADVTTWQALLARLGPAVLTRWLASAPTPTATADDVLRHHLATLGPAALVAAIVGDTPLAAAALAALRGDDALAAAVTAALPEVAALAAPAPPQVEHDPPAAAGVTRPLLDHAAILLGRKLLGLELGDRGRFQAADRDGLSPARFEALAATTARVLAAGLGPALRAAILHLDVAKTTSASHRAAWSAAGVALDIHNEAAAELLRRGGRAATWPLAAPLRELALAWIAAHGLAGQHVRGEGPLLMFAPLCDALAALASPLAAALAVAPADALGLALDGLHVLDACDTAAVREGLLDDALLERLADVRGQLAVVAAGAHDPEAVRAPLRQLAPPPSRAALAGRLMALRAGRQRAGEPAGAVVAAVEALPAEVLAVLAPALATCQLWYCEAATAGLAPATQLALLAAIVGAARRAGLDLGQPWHAQLRPLVARLHGDRPAIRYRLRLVEAAVAAQGLAALLDPVTAPALGPLGTLSTRLGGDAAIVVDYLDSDESAALITLLALYETRSQVAFHTTLKTLCDLYGLRKDEFDRVANEANYLATMNAARSDKERMLDLVRPGRILEVGPGGGVVLDLLEQRFPDSEVLGLDSSREVITALAARARAGDRRWRVVLGAAEDLPRLWPAADLDTVVFCSVLHEVYSYTPYLGADGVARRFQLASVRDVVRAAWQVLRPGGRIVIRDGVRPPDGTRRLRFLAADARPTFELYVAQFEGRRIDFTALPDGRVELSAADAMEFLYTYTWGPASFPYEVRELYGLLTYDAYVASLVDWLGGPTACAVVELPPPLRSYLQPGYAANLAGKIELTDADDAAVALPDSNCLIVVERRVDQRR